MGTSKWVINYVCVQLYIESLRWLVSGLNCTVLSVWDVLCLSVWDGCSWPWDDFSDTLFPSGSLFLCNILLPLSALLGPIVYPPSEKPVPASPWSQPQLSHSGESWISESVSTWRLSEMLKSVWSLSTLPALPPCSTHLTGTQWRKWNSLVSIPFNLAALTHTDFYYNTDWFLYNSLLWKVTHLAFIKISLFLTNNSHCKWNPPRVKCMPLSPGALVLKHFLDL